MSESSPTILVNGRRTEQVSALDRGFTLGDGLFETIAVRKGRVRCWPEHGERLKEGSRCLGLPMPDLGQLEREMEQCRAGDLDGTLRITWTRGPGSRGYAIPPAVTPTRVVAWFPGLPAFPQRPLNIRWCATRLGENPALSGLKHLNRLEQVLARSEWDHADIDEGLMRSVRGDVIECTSSNLFLVAAGALHTPDLSNCGVAGVVRSRVLRLARDMALPIEVRRIPQIDVLAADEVFVTNASRGIAAVGRIGDQSWTAAPGPLTRQLQQALEDSER